MPNLLLIPLIAVAWLSILWMALKLLGPIIGQVIIDFIEHLEERNNKTIDGVAGMEEMIAVAKGVIANLATTDLTSEEKRERAWRDVQATFSGRGYDIGETLAVMAVQIAFLRLKRAGYLPQSR